MTNIVPHSPGPHRKQCRHYNEPGRAHALTFSCFRRQPFLSRQRSCGWMIEVLERTRQRHPVHWWCYVIMSEHVHLLFWPTALEYDVSAILNTIKQSVAKRALLYVRRHAPEFLDRMPDVQPNGKSAFGFWPRGSGYDRNLWEPAESWEKIDYFHANPVRRGLCACPDEWPWTSAKEYLNRGAGLLPIDWDSLRADPRRDATGVVGG